MSSAASILHFLHRSFADAQELKLSVEKRVVAEFSVAQFSVADAAEFLLANTTTSSLRPATVTSFLHHEHHDGDAGIDVAGVAGDDAILQGGESTSPTPTGSESEAFADKTSFQNVITGAEVTGLRGRRPLTVKEDKFIKESKSSLLRMKRFIKDSHHVKECDPGWVHTGSLRILTDTLWEETDSLPSFWNPLGAPRNQVYIHLISVYAVCVVLCTFVLG
jgi:hypothetical protein